MAQLHYLRDEDTLVTLATVAAVAISPKAHIKQTLFTPPHIKLRHRTIFVCRDRALMVFALQTRALSGSSSPAAGRNNIEIAGGADGPSLADQPATACRFSSADKHTFLLAAMDDAVAAKEAKDDGRCHEKQEQKSLRRKCSRFMANPATLFHRHRKCVRTELSFFLYTSRKANKGNFKHLHKCTVPVIYPWA